MSHKHYVEKEVDAREAFFEKTFEKMDALVIVPIVEIYYSNYEQSIKLRKDRNPFFHSPCLISKRRRHLSIGRQK